MVLEGKTPAWQGSYADYKRRLAELRLAGYREHPTLRFEKESEILALVKDLPDNRWCHVQVVKIDRTYQLFAHTEPHAEKDPLGHLACALTEEGIYFGPGTRMVKADMREARRYVDSQHFRNERKGGRQPRMGTCSRCGRAIWSPVSLARGMGSWCYARR